METLPAVSSIPGPTISGSVQVPLAELDKMRSDHANVKQLATELESRQQQIKITNTYTEHIVTSVSEEIYHPGKHGGGLSFSTPGHYETVRKFVNKAIQKEDSIFVNMDQILGSLKEKATKKVQKEIDIIIGARNIAEKQVIVLKKKNSDDKKTYKTSYDKAKTKIQELEADLNECRRTKKNLANTAQSQLKEITKAKETLAVSVFNLDNAHKALAKRPLLQRLFS